MAAANIVTPQRRFSNVSVASVGAAYAAIAPTTTKPTSGVVIDQVSLAQENPSLLRILPYANATAIGAATGVRVIGWTIESDSATGNDTYVPAVLADFTLTFSTGTVPTWTIDGATQRPFALMQQVSGTPFANVYSPGTAAATNVEPAHALVDTIGCQMVTVQFRAASGSPTMGVFTTTM